MLGRLLGRNPIDAAKAARDRAASLRAELETTHAEVAAARAALGEAFAEGDEPATSAARERLERARRRAEELALAVPAAERRAAELEARIAEEERQRAAAEAADAERRRLRAARRMDAALREAESAFQEWHELHGATLSARRRAALPPLGPVPATIPFALRAALWAAAPNLCLRARVDRISAAHWRPLADVGSPAAPPAGAEESEAPATTAV